MRAQEYVRNVILAIVQYATTIIKMNVKNVNKLVLISSCATPARNVLMVVEKSAGMVIHTPTKICPMQLILSVLLVIRIARIVLVPLQKISVLHAKLDGS